MTPTDGQAAAFQIYMSLYLKQKCLKPVLTEQNIFSLQFDLYFFACYHRVWSIRNAAVWLLCVGGPVFKLVFA